jgi:hypothetical protein
MAPMAVILVLFAASWIWFKPYLIPITLVLFILAILYSVIYQVLLYLRTARRIHNRSYLRSIGIAALLKTAGNLVIIVLVFLRITGMIR